MESAESQLLAETENFVLDVGTLECQRWLEEVTGEKFAYTDNLLRSLAEGWQLRRVTNLLLRKEVFTPSADAATVFARAGAVHHLQEFVKDDDWVSQFLLIAVSVLNIFPKYLFFYADLSSHPSNGAVKSGSKFILDQCASASDSLFRVCVTVVKLAVLFQQHFPHHSRTQRFGTDEAQQLLDLFKGRLAGRPVELQIQKSYAQRFVRSVRGSVSNNSINFGSKMSHSPPDDSILSRFLHDLPSATQIEAFSMACATAATVLDDAAGPQKPVTTARRFSEYANKDPVPVHFAQPHNSLSVSMAEQALEQTLLSKKQKEMLQQLKENNKHKDLSDSPEDVRRWRSRRTQKIATNPAPPAASESPALSQHTPLHVHPPTTLSGGPISRQSCSNDTQEQIIISSPKRTQGSQDSGLENSTPEISPPGPQTRHRWRSESASSVSLASSDKLSTVPSLTTSPTQMPPGRFVSSKHSPAPSPPSSEVPVIKSLSALNLQQPPIQIERTASANFLCRKDHSEAAYCKAVVAQGAMDEVSATVRAPPSVRTRKAERFSSVRVEIEATRENHAKVAAVKTVPTVQIARASESFKPMCELIDEKLQRQRSPLSAESSISPASSSKSSDFGLDNGSLDRMSAASSHTRHSSGGSDYKVVALDAKPEPGKLTEFVPEVERSKPNLSEDSAHYVHTYANQSPPPPDAAVVRNWELSDEEQPAPKPIGFQNNNNHDKQPQVLHLNRSSELAYSPDVPKVVLPPKLDKKRSKSVESSKSGKSAKSQKSEASAVSFKSTGSHASGASKKSTLSGASVTSKKSRTSNPAHSDTDSVPSPEPVPSLHASQVEHSDEEPQLHIIRKAREIDDPGSPLEHESSSEEETAKAKPLSPQPEQDPVQSVLAEEETLHYAESEVRVTPNSVDPVEEQQYANINADTLRSNSRNSMEHAPGLVRPRSVTPIERVDTTEYRKVATPEPLFYDTVGRYGFDPSGGYHVPKQVYRRDVPILVEEPRHDPRNRVVRAQPLWRDSPVHQYHEEDETQISKVTYRFYDRNMRELTSNTLVDKARRAMRSYDQGLEYPIEPLETAYYPISGSVDRKWIRSQGYPTPFDASSKNYVNADSKFHILPKDENRSRPVITPVSRHDMPAFGLSDARKVYSDSRHPSGAPQYRPDLFSDEHLASTSPSLLTVSGKLRCAHCSCELGRGSAMIIEALGLFYHISCFRCHVCEKTLGSGSRTTDVRVRDGKLHCEKCYSNEDIGVRLSQI